MKRTTNVLLCFSFTVIFSIVFFGCGNAPSSEASRNNDAQHTGHAPDSDANNNSSSNASEHATTDAGQEQPQLDENPSTDASNDPNEQSPEAPVDADNEHDATAPEQDEESENAPKEPGQEDENEPELEDDGGNSTDNSECIHFMDCPFGQGCRYESPGQGQCQPNECHNGDPDDDSVGPKPCAEGYTCMFGDGPDLYHGQGWCEPDDDASQPEVEPCSFNSDCTFGNECRYESPGQGQCQPSECHEGNPFDDSVDPRPCPEGYMCMFGDGVDLNHGNGWCEPY